MKLNEGDFYMENNKFNMIKGTYNENSIFLNASSRLPSSSPSSVIFNIISVGIVLDRNTGVITDCTVTLLSEGAIDFIRYLVIGHDLKKDGIKSLIQKIKYQYLGESQNAICMALERVYSKYKRLVLNLDFI